MNTKTNLVNQESELKIQPASEDQLDFIEICIERQNEKLQRIASIKQEMTAKHNEQTRFYLLMFKAVIAMALIVLVGCLIAAEMTVHVGAGE